MVNLWGEVERGIGMTPRFLTCHNWLGGCAISSDREYSERGTGWEGRSVIRRKLGAR